MPKFQFEAMDHKTGAEVTDTIDAPSEAEAQSLIREKGLLVTKITETGRKKAAKTATKKKGDGKKRVFTIGKIKQKKLCAFTRQLSTLQDAGLPILRSLRILEGQSKPGVLKNTLMNVIEDVESGNTLSEAMAKNPKAFDNLYCNMVKAGEASGALEVILQRLAEFKERAQSLKRTVQGAMVYPIVVILVATCIVGFILYYIIPKFEVIFRDFEIKLPWITELLISMSQIVVKYFYLFPAIPFACWLFIKIVKKNKTGEYIVDYLTLKIPVLGKIVSKATTARTCRTLGTLIASGVPILERGIVSEIDAVEEVRLEVRSQRHQENNVLSVREIVSSRNAR